MIRPSLLSPAFPAPISSQRFTQNLPCSLGSPFSHHPLGSDLYVAFLQTLDLNFLTSHFPILYSPPSAGHFFLFLCSPGWPGTRRDPHASASRVVGLEAYASTAQQMFLNPIKLTVEITLRGSPAGQMWSVCPGIVHSLGWGGEASSS